MAASLLAIALLHWAVLLVPGFNFVLLCQLAAGRSRVTALAAAMGMSTGTLMWASLAVFGVGAVFATQPVLRQVVQGLGGAYLVYLALRMWRSGAQVKATSAPSLSPAAAYRLGFMTSALNPKIALFYGSVFATALPADPSSAHVAGAVVVVLANSLIWHVSLVVFFSHERIQRAYLRRFAALTRMSAAVVGAYGARLLWATAQELRSR